MARLRHVPAFVIVAYGLLLLIQTIPAQAQGADFDLKVAAPGPDPRAYAESFPMEVEATARLWNQIKFDSVEEQTQALKVEFEQFKAVQFQRQESVANQVGIQAIQGQPQPEHVPALMATPIRW